MCIVVVTRIRQGVRGVRDLRQSGLAKVRAAVTTLEEVLAATKD